MIRRIYNVFVLLICITLLIPSILTIPLLSLFYLFRYIITGEEDAEVIFIVMDYIIFELPDKLGGES